MFTKIFFITLICIANINAKTVVTTLPEFAWAVKKLDPSLKVISLLEGTEDPHFIDASPGFIFKVAKADLVVSNGMELEIGWLPKIVSLSGNSKIQLGTSGNCDASKSVEKIGAIQNYDRSMGDVHPLGNPHYTLSIPRMIESMDTIKNCLILIGADKKVVNSNFRQIKSKMNKAFSKLKNKIKTKKFYVFHREFNYLGKDFNLKFVDSLEKVPGVLPSANHLAHMALKAKKDLPSKVIAGSTAPVKTLEKFKELSGVKYILLNLHPKLNQDYLEFIKDITTRIYNE